MGDETYAKTGTGIKRTGKRVLMVGTDCAIGKLAADKRLDYLAGLSQETGLPCVDPIIDGCGAIVEPIRQLYPEV